MSVWFEGSIGIECDIEQVRLALDDHGALYAGIVSLMPAMTGVELVDQGDTTATIRTNEGLMKRTRISKQSDAGRVAARFDETYEAGSKVTTNSHFSEEFTAGDTGVTYRLIISDVESPGVLGFFYKTFGNSKTGTAFLTAYKTYFEEGRR